MSETDINSMNLDFSELSQDVEEINKAQQTILYLLWWSSGVLSTLFITNLYSVFKKCTKKDEKTEIIKIPEEKISLLDAVNNLENRVKDIAIAFSVNNLEDNREKNEVETIELKVNDNNNDDENC